MAVPRPRTGSTSGASVHRRGTHGGQRLPVPETGMVSSQKPECCEHHPGDDPLEPEHRWPLLYNGMRGNGEIRCLNGLHRHPRTARPPAKRPTGY